MHEPVRLHGFPFSLPYLAVIESVAVEPEPQTAFVLDAKVIARKHRAFRAPPFRGDAFGTFSADHIMAGAAPDKPCRRAIRHLRDDLDLFRPFEQPQRP